MRPEMVWVAVVVAGSCTFRAQLPVPSLSALGTAPVDGERMRGPGGGGGRPAG